MLSSAETSWASCAARELGGPVPQVLTELATVEAHSLFARTIRAGRKLAEVVPNSVSENKTKSSVKASDVIPQIAVITLAPLFPLLGSTSILGISSTAATTAFPRHPTNALHPESSTPAPRHLSLIQPSPASAPFCPLLPSFLG